MRNLVGAGLALIALTSTGAASDQAGEPRRRDTVRAKEGRLSVDVQGRTLEWVLGQISRAANVAFVTDEAPPETTVSVQFGDIPLDEGLRRILKDQDTFFFYEAQGNAPSALRVVWVYPKGQGRSIQPVPPERWASTRDLEKLLTDPDADARSRAVESLIERQGEKARAVVLRALKDDSARVRTQALYGAFSSGLELPADVLAEALDDPSSDVRFLALEAIAGRPEAAPLARRALGDANQHVRERAREIVAKVGQTGGER
ncbi:MAG TPA: HEAT repeat domain-containing protein [Vicinamibacteria bacterium]